jgi:hypothetical protein
VADGLAGSALGERIVEMEDIDAVAAEAFEAGLEGGRHCRADAAAVCRCDAHLGGDDDVRLQLGQHPPEVGLGGAVAVERGGVEVVDAELERPRHRALLVARLAARHQSADRAAPERQDRHL